MQNTAFSKFLVRIPVFPFSFLRNIMDSEDDSWITELINNKILMHGILIASPDFFNEVSKFIDLKDDNKKERIKLTLLKYAIRCSTRCVPFGLFSGVGILNYNKESDEDNGKILIGESNQYSRLDFKYSSKILDQINSSNAIRENLDYFVNTTLYSLSESYRFIDFSVSENGMRDYELIQIKKNEYLKKILKKCISGFSYNQMVDLLLDEGFEVMESKSYINQLIDNKIIVSELEPSTIGYPIEQKILSVLGKKISDGFISDDINYSYKYLRDIKNTLEIIDSKSISESFEEAKCFVNSLSKNELTEQINFNPLYKEIYFETFQNFSKKQKKLINNGVEIFDLLTSLKENSQKTRLDIFKESFLSKYELETIPLIIALDVETGIGYDDTLNSSGVDKNHLIDNFPKNEPKNGVQIEWGILDSFIVRKIEESIISSSNTIEVNDKDLDYLLSLKNKKVESNLSSTGIIRFSLFEGKLEENIIYIDSVSKSSPNKILGRFSLGNKLINNLTEEIAKHEDMSYDDGTIIAEIDHLPYTGFGNTLLRSDLGRLKISYHGGANSDNKNISISDLYVSHRNGEIILTSEKLKKRIIPYFSNAFNDNFPNTLPIFKFLLDIHYQYEDKQNGYLNINKYHNYFKNIPRINHKNIILSKESWYVAESDFVVDKKDKKNDSTDKFKENCKKLKLPKYFTIVDGDMELLIDIDNVYSIKLFLSELKKKEKLHLKEFLMSNLNSIVMDKATQLQFNNEFFLPFKNNLVKKANFSYSKKSIENVERIFLPGSEWISLKLYIGSNKADKLLIELEKSLDYLIKNKDIKLFYFIKYSDPDYHIRLRLLLTDIDNFSSSILQINKVLNKYTENKFIKNVVMDSYKRELERYGGGLILTFERVFYLDSKLVINILKHVQASSKQNKKWLYCIIIIDIYLDAFGFSDDLKIKFSETMKDNFSNEFYTNKHINKFINEKYSHYSEEITNLLESYKEKFLDFNINQFKKYVTKEIKNFSDLDENIKMKYLSSVVHMHIIRLMGPHNNRLYELIIYNFYCKVLKANFYKNKL